tara:strand:- start:5966 stop:6316 length:351 start_codon:yes stop_codon:yes gene_type:complete
MRWGDKSILKSIKNPTDERYEISIHCPELTFMGDKEQPDFGCVDMTMVPSELVIELKSFKKYVYGFRDSRMSYERFINVVYDDVMEIYKPSKLTIEVEFRPRGGISSKLKIDSDWR